MIKNNVWMSVSDLMTGLMVIFLFIAISYISKVQEQAINLSDYVETKSKLHDKLIDEFKNDTSAWSMTIDRDLSMKFKNAQVLFPTGSDELTPEFKFILDEFLPRYFDILLNDELRNHIKEVRIEGHTDDVPYPMLDDDPYLANAILSQRRSLSVLRYFHILPCYQKYTSEERSLLEYWLTANGLSYGRALDSEGENVFVSKRPIDREKSRRVEFRIITDSERLLENFVQKNQSN